MMGINEVKVDGRRIKLAPIIDDIRSDISNAPDRVSTFMRIPFNLNNPELQILDSRGYAETLEKEYPKVRVPKANRTGALTICSKEKILIKVDYEERRQRRELYAYMEGEPRYEMAIAYDILRRVWHEVAHLSHESYDARLLDTPTERKLREMWEFASKEKGHSGMLAISKRVREMEKELPEEEQKLIRTSEIIRNNFGWRRRTAIVEGIATWVALSMLEKQEVPNATRGFRIFKDGDEPGLLFNTACVLFFSSRYHVGYWFVDTVSNLVSHKPIKLIIDHPPITYRELFNPERYVKRMEREGYLSE